MQARIADELKRIIEEEFADLGLVFTNQREHANTGVIYVQDEMFETAFQVRYDFQLSYASLHFKGAWLTGSGAARAEPGWRGGSTVASVELPHLEYAKSEQMSRPFRLVTSVLYEHLEQMYRDRGDTSMVKIKARWPITVRPRVA